MSDVYFEESELWKLLELWNTSKSTCFYELHTVELKGAKSVIVKALGLLFRNSCEESGVPMDWKRANITALHKSGPKSKPNNYRPLSLT